MYFLASTVLIVALIAILWRIVRLLIRVVKKVLKFVRKAIPVAFLMMPPILFSILFATSVESNILWAIPLAILLIGYFAFFTIIYLKWKKHKENKLAEEATIEEGNPYRVG